MAILKQKFVMLHPGPYKGARERKLMKSTQPQFRHNVHSNTCEYNINFETPSDIHILWEVFNEQNIIVHLKITLVGSTTVPDLSEYSNTVKRVEFSGHICSIRTALKMITQLKVCDTVVFFLGTKQQLPILENESEEDLQSMTTVTYLFMNLTLPENCPENEDLIDVLNCQLIGLFENAVKTFPNLNQLKVDLPGTGIFYDLLKKHLVQWKHLKDVCTAEIRNNKVYVGIHRPQLPPPKVIPHEPHAAVKDIQSSTPVKDKENSESIKEQQKNCTANRKRKSSESGTHQYDKKDAKKYNSEKQKQRHEGEEKYKHRRGSSDSDHLKRVYDPASSSLANMINSQFRREYEGAQLQFISDNPFIRAEQNPDVKPFQLKEESKLKGQSSNKYEPNESHFGSRYQRAYTQDNFANNEPRNPRDNLYSQQTSPSFHNNYSGSAENLPSLNDTSLMSTDEEGEDDTVTRQIPDAKEFENMFERRGPREERKIPQTESSSHSVESSSGSLTADGPIRLDLMFYQEQIKKNAN